MDKRHEGALATICEVIDEDRLARQTEDAFLRVALSTLVLHLEVQGLIDARYYSKSLRVVAKASENKQLQKKLRELAKTLDAAPR